MMAERRSATIAGAYSAQSGIAVHGQRKFGGLWLAEDPAVVLLPLSPEPLEGEFTTKWLTASPAGRKAPVKTLLPGLSIAAGLGNPYADESLFLSGIRTHGTWYCPACQP